jgi:hypothetical protein
VSITRARSERLHYYIPANQRACPTPYSFAFFFFLRFPSCSLLFPFILLTYVSYSSPQSLCCQFFSPFRRLGRPYADPWITRAKPVEVTLLFSPGQSSTSDLLGPIGRSNSSCRHRYSTHCTCTCKMSAMTYFSG